MRMRQLVSRVATVWLNRSGRSTVTAAPLPNGLRVSALKGNVRAWRSPRSALAVAVGEHVKHSAFTNMSTSRIVLRQSLYYVVCLSFPTRRPYKCVPNYVLTCTCVEPCALSSELFHRRWRPSAQRPRRTKEQCW